MTRSYRAALGELAAAQKSGAGVPAYLRWVNRGLGRRAAAAAYVLGLGPNAVTMISGIASLGGLLCLVALPLSIASAVTASVLLLVGYALDSADGQLARLTGTGSLAGEWLDHVVDSVRLPLVHLAIAVCLFANGEELWIVGVALLWSVAASSWFFAQTLAAKLSASAKDDGSGADGTPAWVSFAKLPYDVGTLYLVVAALAYPPAFIVLYSALFIVTVGVAALSLRRKYRVLLSEDPSRTLRRV